jgi:hypothetical protein
MNLGFTPDVSRVGMLEWDSFDKVVQIGLQIAREILGEDERVLQPARFNSQFSSRP